MTYRLTFIIIVALFFSIKTVVAENPAPPVHLFIEDAVYCIQDNHQSVDPVSTLTAIGTEALCWKPIAEFHVPDLLQAKDLFIKISMPNTRWKDQAVYITAFSYGFEVYQDYKKKYQYEGVIQQSEITNKKKNFRYYQSHIIPIENTLSPNDLIIRIFSHAGFNFGDIHTIMTGTKDDLMNILINDNIHAFRKGIKDLLLSALLIFIGSVSLFVYIIRWKHRDLPFFCFGFFSFCVGIKYLFTQNLLFLFNFSPMTYGYLEYISFLLVPVGLFAFVEQMFGPGRWMIIRRLWQFHLLIAVSAVFMIPLNLMTYFFVVIIILLVNCFICLWFIFISKAYDDIKPKIPFIAFFILFIILLFVELFVDFLGVFYVDTWTYDLFGWGILALVFSLGYVLVNHYTTTYQKMQHVSLELEKSRYEMLALEQKNLTSQFEALKNQINPHFLFNNFSTLVSIIEENRDMAVSFVQELSHVYRYILQTKKKSLVEVREELDFLKSYEFLLSKRFDNKIALSISIDAHHMNCFIPPFSLQLLVENAIKHNVISSKKPLVIEIFYEGSYLCVKNNLQEKKVPEGSTKIGLSNIIGRYRYFTEREVLISSDHTAFIVKIPLIKDNKDI